MRERKARLLKQRERKREMLDYLEREREMLGSLERERGTGRERERPWDPLIESGEIQREMYAILL